MNRAVPAAIGSHAYHARRAVLYLPAMRVVSLLPAATEITAALGMADALAAVSHECDWPPEVAARPRATRCDIHGNRLASRDTDRWVRERLRDAGTLYTMDEALLRTIAPDVILTQRLCDVCAVGYDSVTAFAATLPRPPRIVNLEPERLANVFEDVRRVAAALGVPERAERVVAALADRIAVVRRRTAALERRRCVLLEWIDPPFRSGHWGPELVDAAGGTELLGVAGADAAEVPWTAVRDAAPDVLVLACCGYDVARTLADVPILRGCPGFDALPAVRAGAVWAIDGSAYVSRPGPRLVDSIELLARCLHPDALGEPDPARAVRVT
jgi:iron complex transport system substrate-binding protein